MSKEIDFSDTLFILSCGCILDGCSGAANVDRFARGEGRMFMYCLNDHQGQRAELVRIVTVGEINGDGPVHGGDPPPAGDHQGTAG